jgi:uncharacterized protein involved in exopolysaccharide biosynthesis
VDYVEIGKTIANLGLIPALGIALIIIWKQWWKMVGQLKTAYDNVIAQLNTKLVEKDAIIAAQNTKIEALGEKRLEEYRTLITDYRDTLEVTNGRDAELAVAQQATNRMLEALLNNRGGTP